MSTTTTNSVEERTIEVDVIVPVHNAASTLRQTVESALLQQGLYDDDVHRFRVFVCCYDDGSSDDSWELLTELAQEHIMRQNQSSSPSSSGNQTPSANAPLLQASLLIARAEDGVSRGAGFARNRAVELREKDIMESSEDAHRFLAMLDSDDVMMPTRLAAQAHDLCSIQNEDERNRTLLGCNFVRDPPQSTWHYTKWANELTDERLVLEKFREVTLVQPTWMMSRSWFSRLGGYLEAPPPVANPAEQSVSNYLDSSVLRKSGVGHLTLIDSAQETFQTLRVAEDTRFFYKHLDADGSLRLLRTDKPLLMYRHREGQSQSSQTPRKLLLGLRVRALEHLVLSKHPTVWSRFCVWGAGRDGKDFVKALRPEFRNRVYCMVDVDEKKINLGHYVHKEWGLRIPIVHFSLLARDAQTRASLRSSFESGAHDAEQPGFGRIQKNQDATETPKPENRPAKRRKASHVGDDLDEQVLATLPVVVCVAMYRTGGALEHNVHSIGRTEGVDLWHFS